MIWFLNLFLIIHSFNYLSPKDTAQLSKSNLQIYNGNTFRCQKFLSRLNIRFFQYWTKKAIFEKHEKTTQIWLEKRKKLPFLCGDLLIEFSKFEKPWKKKQHKNTLEMMHINLNEYVYTRTHTRVILVLYTTRYCLTIRIWQKEIITSSGLN